MNRVAYLLGEAAQLSQRAARYAQEGRLDEALDLEVRADLLRDEARSEAKRDKPATRVDRANNVTTARSVPARQVTIAVLNELGVPTGTRIAADYANARFGVDLDSRLFAALRRDERRAWKAPASHRPVHVVPALEGRMFLAMRGKLALSIWDLPSRIIGPWSERVDHLGATINAAKQLAWMRNTGTADTVEMEMLVRRLAATIPGAPGKERVVDTDRVEDAANIELSVLADEDFRWRADAAERARSILDDEDLLWGARAPEDVTRRAG